MKLKILLLALFVAGLASSLAFASPGHGRGGDAGTTTAAHGKSKHENDGKAKGNASGKACHNVSLKGALADGTLSLKVTKGNRAAKALRDTTVTLAFSGNAAVQARLCGTGNSQTLAVRVLKVADAKPSKESKDAPTSTTTTETTTGETTTAETTTAETTTTP